MTHRFLKLTLDLDVRTDAFQPNPMPEIARILNDLANRVKDTPPAFFPPNDPVAEALTFTLYDVHGQEVGRARLS